MTQAITQATNQTIYVLMNGDTPIAAYQSQALADGDCWICNAALQRNGQPQDYWVKPLDLVVVDEPAQN